MNVREAIPDADLILISLDALRYDVAQELFEDDKLPNFAKWLPDSGWEERYSPASFTYPSHHAFFSGFLPTKINQRITPRLFSSAFLGSESTTAQTFIFEEATIVEALRNLDYQTVCIGGVGFFNKQTAISKVFPGLFEYSEWQTSFGVTEKKSTENQFQAAEKYLSTEKSLMLFINISATHQPTNIYLDRSLEDDKMSQKAALIYVDQQLEKLQTALKIRNRETVLVICSDHGTAFGEDDQWGHRNGHEVVMKVPYLQKKLNEDNA